MDFKAYDLEDFQYTDMSIQENLWTSRFFKDDFLRTFFFTCKPLHLLRPVQTMFF